MTPETEQALLSLLERIERQDEIIQMIVETMEGQEARIREAADAANRMAAEKRQSLGRTIALPGGNAPGTQTETLLSDIVGRAAKRKYNE